jgi:hypothetical protein
MWCTLPREEGAAGPAGTIQSDLKQTRGAQDTLKDDRRAEVRAATEQFLASVTSIVKGLRTDVSLSEAKPRPAETGQQLRAA